MRRASRVDTNQSEVVDALRKAGASVLPLHAVGGGCPDLLVGQFGVNFLIEVKDGTKPPSARTLTPPQVTFHDEWRGQKAVVKSSEEALALLRRTTVSVPVVGSVDGRGRVVR